MFIVAAIVFPQSFYPNIKSNGRQMPFRITKNVLQFTGRRRTVDSARENSKGWADGSIHELGPMTQPKANGK